MCDMANRTRWPLLRLLLALCVIGSLRAQNPPIYALLGGELTLKPTPPISEAVTRIVWKRPDQLVAEFRNNHFTYYGAYQGRTKLAADGTLDISGARHSDSASYSLEVNNQIVPGEYRAEVITEVPKPTVRVSPVSCSSDLANCTVNCEGDTDKAGSVDITWFFDENPKTGDKKIVIDRETSGVKQFSCQMTNLFSEKRSDPKDNPFYKPPIIIIVIVIISLCALTGVFGFALMKRHAIKDRFCTTGNTSNGGSGVGTEATGATLLQKSPTDQNETGSAAGHIDGETGSAA